MHSRNALVAWSLAAVLALPQLASAAATPRASVPT